MAIEKRTAAWIMYGLAIMAFISALAFFDISVLGLEKNMAGLLTIIAAGALIFEVGLNKIVSGKIKDEPTSIVSIVVAGMGLLAGLLSLMGVQVAIIASFGGVINILLAIFLIIEAMR